MAKKYTTECRHCGATISTGLKVCPHCGGKVKPFHDRLWFWILVIVIVGGIYSFIKTPSAPPADIEYVDVTADQLFEELSNNPVNASEKYKGAYVSVTGRMDVIDSDGEYIGVYPMGEDYSLDSVHCTITSDEQLEKIKSMSKGDTVTVKGKITDIGEILGYYLSIDSIE